MSLSVFSSHSSQNTASSETQRLQNQEKRLRHRLEREAALYGCSVRDLIFIDGKWKKRKEEPSSNAATTTAQEVAPAIEPQQQHQEQNIYPSSTSYERELNSDLMHADTQRDENILWNRKRNHDDTTRAILIEKEKQRAAEHAFQQRVEDSREKRLMEQRERVAQSLEKAEYQRKANQKREEAIQRKREQSLHYCDQIMKEAAEEGSLLISKRKEMREYLQDAPEKHHLQERIQLRNERMQKQEQDEERNLKRLLKQQEKDETRRQRFSSYLKAVEDSKRDDQLKAELIEAQKRNVLAKQNQKTADRFRSKRKRQVVSPSNTEQPSNDVVSTEESRDASPLEQVSHPRPQTLEQFLETMPPLPENCSPRRAKMLRWEYLSSQLSEMQHEMGVEQNGLEPLTANGTADHVEEKMEALTQQAFSLLQSLRETGAGTASE